MVLLENDVFLTHLKEMFAKSRQKGTVQLTMKRYDGRTKPRPKNPDKELPEPSEHLCLIRAVHKSKKLSTVVHSKDVNKFQLAYCSLLKTSFDGLQKRSKKSKSKAT
ncbi:unnamed protein product [Bemisia tabaci]|uniref:Signal recognition particle 14 kDa protein n=1 Tax=Bemisia tabaci TaxID=7038 RepID=A0AAI8UU71_BEMTA|nr:PREDICTED: signal recognition particle 14 kDa protein-like [Bemisia tabaci]CAH0747330.1 unnamed protein product [Bemisia tabaci]